MKSLSRRDFLHNTAALSAALAAIDFSDVARAAEDAKPVAKGESVAPLRVAVLGVNGRGKEHVRGFAGRHNCVVATICDVDSAVIGDAMKIAEKNNTGGVAPKYVQDLRKVMDDPTIDIVSIATPNHWHSLAAIWAMQAGKDVYVEKPVSHNVSEGRRVVEAARKYKRICQAGTQCRSQPGTREAIEFIKAGKLGEVQIARGLCYKLRPPIGKVTEPTPIAETVDYDLWCGPAPKGPLLRKRLHYDWHWVWNNGNGDLGNQGIHQMDVARWGLGKSDLGKSVQSIGGRFGKPDDGQTANTQIAVFDYGDAELIFEVRGFPTAPFNKEFGTKDRNCVGNVFHCTDGYLVCTNYSTAVACDPHGKIIKKFAGEGDHFGNFVDAVRSRKVEDLHGEILEGHLSSAMCHLSNISYRLGTPQPFDKKKQAFGDDKAAAETMKRMEEHLEADPNLMVLSDLKYQLGPKLLFDSHTETFNGNKEADALLTREYRKGFEVPAKL